MKVTDDLDHPKNLMLLIIVLSGSPNTLPDFSSMVLCARRGERT